MEMYKNNIYIYIFLSKQIYIYIYLNINISMYQLEGLEVGSSKVEIIFVQCQFCKKGSKEYHDWQCYQEAKINGHKYSHL